MREYQSFNCSVIGHSHIMSGYPCQDSSASFDDKNMHIAITADGHGDRRCFRSDVGSSILCEIALRAMQSFANNLQKSEQEKKLFIDHQRDKIVAHLFKSILGQWTTQMLEHAAQNPPSEEELANVPENTAAVYRNGQSLIHMYGTTLIAALMTKSYLLLLQQGDGHCTVIYQDGTMAQPVPWDSRCVGRDTTSMCDKDVLSSWRYVVIDMQKQPVIAVFCSSDGVEDSFETMEATLAYLGNLTSDYVEEGKGRFLDTLGPHLSNMSEFGSKDDMSISAIIDRESLTSFTEIYRLRFEQVKLETELQKSINRLASMERKTAFLADQVDVAKKEYQRAVTDRNSTQSRLESLLYKLTYEENILGKNEETVNFSKKQLEKAIKDQEDYRQIHVEVEKKADRARQALKSIKDRIATISVPKTVITEKVNEDEIDEYEIVKEEHQKIEGDNTNEENAERFIKEQIPESEVNTSNEDEIKPTVDPGKTESPVNTSCEGEEDKSHS